MSVMACQRLLGHFPCADILPANCLARSGIGQHAQIRSIPRLATYRHAMLFGATGRHVGGSTPPLGISVWSLSADILCLSPLKIEEFLQTATVASCSPGTTWL